MFTQCRGCGEIFKVVVDELVTASAMVRCSSCGAVFNSLDTLSDYKPQESADLILHEHDNPPPLLTHEYKQSVIQEIGKKISNKEENVRFNAAFDDFEEEQIFAEKPEFVDDIEEESKENALALWMFLTLILFSGLAWQASEGLKDGSLTLSEGELRHKVCGYIDCYVGNENSNLNKIALVSRSIRQHPGRDNALIITAGIINSDENIQTFPALQIKMSNLNGETVAMRRFLPHEYVDRDTMKIGMLPNTLIPITLDLQSPGKNAVTFEVGFSPTFGSR